MTDVHLTGQYRHNIDAKGRLFIPVKLREELGDLLHVTIGQDHCLSIYSDDLWKEKLEKLEEQPYSVIKKLRPMFANAADCEPDAQGRILLPPKLREYAGLTKEVVVTGSLNRAEIWDVQRWEELENEGFDSGSVEEAMEQLGM